jgi:nitrous oxidase accessory protein NosD
MPHTPVSPSPRRAQAWPALPALIGGVLVAALAIGAALGPYAQAVAPCHVPGDYVTLQAAVDDPDCAIINVAAGTYTGNFPIDRDVTIRGDGQDRTFIEGVGLGSVVQIDSGAAVTIKGVTIQGGASTFGGGLFNGGRLTLENSTVTANAATLGGGLFNAEGSTLTLKNSTVVSPNSGFLRQGT